MRKINWAEKIYGLAAVVFLWQGIHYIADSSAIPAPFAVLVNCLSMLTTTDMPLHLTMSLLRLIVSITFAIVIGSALGLFMGLNESFNRLISPVLHVFFPIPKVALLPILFIFFGLGEVSKILLIFLILVFQIVFMIRDTIKTLPQGILLSAQSMHLSPGQLLWHIYLPSLSKTLISALRISIGTGIAVLFFAENYATPYGLGVLIMNSWSLINYLDMYSGIVFLSLLGASLFTLLDVLERKFCRWHY